MIKLLHIRSLEPLQYYLHKYTLLHDQSYYEVPAATRGASSSITCNLWCFLIPLTMNEKA
jgi:hypothetical protein